MALPDSSKYLCIDDVPELPNGTATVVRVRVDYEDVPDFTLARIDREGTLRTFSRELLPRADCEVVDVVNSTGDHSEWVFE